jgi:hypothetical protein
MEYIITCLTINTLKGERVTRVKSKIFRCKVNFAACYITFHVFCKTDFNVLSHLITLAPFIPSYLDTVFCMKAKRHFFNYKHL